VVNKDVQFSEAQSHFTRWWWWWWWYTYFYPAIVYYHYCTH